jgi:DNA polymerase V
MPTADPVLLTKAAHALLPQVYEGVKYARAGIMVTDLRPSGNQKPLEIFENPHEERGIGTLLEDVAKRYGRGSIGLGHAGIKGGPDWTMKRDMPPPLHHEMGRTAPRQSRLKPNHPHDRTTKERPT